MIEELKFSDFRFKNLRSLNRILNTEVSRISVIHLHPRLFEDISTEWADNDIFFPRRTRRECRQNWCVCGAVGALQRATCIQMHRADRDWTASRIDFLPDNLPLSLTHLVRYLHVQDVSRE